MKTPNQQRTTQRKLTENQIQDLRLIQSKIAKLLEDTEISENMARNLGEVATELSNLQENVMWMIINLTKQEYILKT